MRRPRPAKGWDGKWRADRTGAAAGFGTAARIAALDPRRRRVPGWPTLRLPPKLRCSQQSQSLRRYRSGLPTCPPARHFQSRPCQKEDPLQQAAGPLHLRHERIKPASRLIYRRRAAALEVAAQRGPVSAFLPQRCRGDKETLSATLKLDGRLKNLNPSGLSASLRLCGRKIGSGTV